MARTRSAESYKRRAPQFKVQPLVLVVCEDKKSSKTYFEEASRHFRAYAQVEFFHSGKTDPLGVVNSALKRLNAFDHVYCVIDRDSHDERNFQSAVALSSANAGQITLLTSYPCFEFWLILHFGYTRAPFVSLGGVSAADRVVQQLKSNPVMSDYAKGNVAKLFERLLPLLPVARNNAARSVAEAAIEGDWNPSTPLHLLIERFEKLGDLVPTD